MAVGLFLCVSFCPYFALTAKPAVIFSLMVSLYFVAPGDVCPGGSTAAKGPRSQPVSLQPLDALQVELKKMPLLDHF